MMTHSNVRHEKRSHGKRGCQCAALIRDGRAAEFLLLEQFSNGVNTYTRGNGSGTSRKNERYCRYSTLPERHFPPCLDNSRLGDLVPS
jgi:hypothetical protein